MASREIGQESKRKARIIADILNKRKIKLYFLFLCFIVKELKKFNAAFQTVHCHPKYLYDPLHQLHQGICARVYNKSKSILKSFQIAYRATFTLESNVLLMKLKRGEIVEFFIDQKIIAKVICRHFLLKLLNDLKKRIISPKNIFQSLFSFFRKMFFRRTIELDLKICLLHMRKLTKIPI